MSSFNPQNYVISTYVGQCPYTVTIDESEELSALIQEAEKLKALPFSEKLEAVKELTKKAMRNAWEGSEKGDLQCRSIVFEQHSLSDALKQRLGCCRYQSSCFLILGAAANLGTKHYLQSTRVNRSLQTCYNDVYDENGKVHHVSVFAASLSDQRYNYTKDPTIFERPNIELPDQHFLAYRVDANGTCIRYSRQGCHFNVDLEKMHQKIKALREAEAEARRAKAAEAAVAQQPQDSSSLYSILLSLKAQGAAGQPKQYS